MINATKVMLVDVSDRIRGSDLRTEHGNAATSIVKFKDGSEGVMITLNGDPLRNHPSTGERLRYADGTPMFDTPGDLLLHEFSGHGFPLFVRGAAADTENAIDHDNYIRGRLGLKLRPQDPDHTVRD